MKNKFFIPILVATIVTTLFSCEDDFIKKEPSEFLTQDQVSEAGPTAIVAVMRGIYSQMIETQTGGTTGADDFGQKGYDIFGDMLSGDMALSVSTFGWYRASITEFQGPLDFTFGDNRQVWRYYYRIVRSANATIAALDLADTDAIPNDPEIANLLGQAKAMRAHSYFYLTQYFANDYNPSAEILPFYDDIDDLNGPKVATSQIYDLMESDLRSAIVLLDQGREAKYAINKSVAQGILAYVLGSKRDSWTEVASLTKDVIDNGGFRLMNAEEITGGFNDVSTPGWMWGIDLTPEIALGLGSWWGQVDSFSYSYAWAGDFKAIDQGLYDQIPENDARKEQFRDVNYPGRPLMPLNKFYDPARQIGGTAQTTEDDYVYMRVAEMYLLHAEASAKAGIESDAITILKELLDERIPDSSYIDALTGQALLDEIYLQTRIELWGEGKSYLAMKRNQATIVRGTNHLSNVGIPIDHDDERLTFEIPQLEIQNNPFIDTQN